VEANILVEAYNSTSQEYSPHPRGEKLLRQFYTNDGLQHASLDFPLMVVIASLGERKARNLHTTVKAKLERLHKARLARRDQAVRLLDM
jgi:hypothetical protein